MTPRVLSAKLHKMGQPLKVIPQPEADRTVMEPDFEGPVVKGEAGDAGVSYDCGNCGTPLIVGVNEGQVRDLVIRCWKCRSFNEI